MIDNSLKISRRQFLASTGAGVLAAWLVPGMLVAAGRNVAPVVPGNPLFSGALGRYEGVNIIHSIDSPLDDFKFLVGDRWTGAQQDLFTRGSAAVKVNGNKGRWIPFNKMIRKG